jgi:23S rRNA (adenine2503-C2)-methyltransferase
MLSDMFYAFESASIFASIGVASSIARYDSAMFIQVHPFRNHLKNLDAKLCHQERLLRLWLQGLPLSTPGRRPQHVFPKAMAAQIGGLSRQLDSIALVESRHVAEDQSIRLLLKLHDLHTVETVLLPRDGLCISSQVGCAVGCVFCMTGRSGLLRQLGSMEMLAQVALARQIRTVRKVVFMGMGEPAHNLENVIEVIQILGSLGGIAHKNLVFSTVGDARVFERLPLERVKPALALSLHSSKPALRAKLLPRAPRLEPAELVAMAESYARSTGYPIQYQWALMDGINDGPEEIDGIVELLSGKYAVMNLIPFNSVDGADFARPPWERAEAMALALNKRGVLTTLRRSAGQDVDAGCGQLRARSLPAKAIELHLVS